MSWPEHSLNVTFIVVYLVVLAWHGWYGQRRTRSLSDFLIGGRQLGGVLIGLALGVGVKFVVEPRQLSRFYGLASDERLRRGRWIAPTLLFLTYLTMLPVGFLAHAFTASPDRFHDLSGHIDTDLVIPWLLGPEGNVLGPVAGAFFLTALVAAATFGWFLVKRSFAGGALQNWHEVYVGTAVSLMIYVAVSVVRR